VKSQPKIDLFDTQVVKEYIKYKAVHNTERTEVRKQVYNNPQRKLVPGPRKMPPSLDRAQSAALLQKMTMDPTSMLKHPTPIHAIKHIVGRTHDLTDQNPY